MQAILAQLTGGEHLSPDQATDVMEMIASGQATGAQIASLITALRMKGETAEEITSFVRVLLRHAVIIRPQVSGRLVDTCGTGGDNAGTFNISTAAAFVAAGAGVPVVKHGNRSVSSSCGSADVLEALGVNIDLSPERVCSVVEETGIGFLFAPAFHPAMRHAAAPRKELGFSTVFNLLGPLLNPAGAPARLCGVYSPGLVDRFSIVLQQLGTERAMVVHGQGLDEITVSGPTIVAEIDGGTIRRYTLSPEEFGIPRSPHSSLAGRSPRDNAEIIRMVLSGAPGPAHDVVVLNAGAAILLGDKAPDLEQGVLKADEAIASGAASERLEALIQASGSRE
ncbi:MAG: anthranilate phosphoribosyltransferase [Methanoregulaceae archaeon]|nr:anthranilate phosphoribosyltransferase [Methanoregulaceae archaeon]